MNLILAASEGNLAEVRVILNREANLPDIYDLINVALFTGAKYGRLSIVRDILDRDLQDDVRKDIALFVAERSGHRDIVQETLNYGANINQLSLESRTRYRDLMPKIITIQIYYQLEPLVERLIEFENRYLFLIKGSKTGYILSKLL